MLLVDGVERCGRWRKQAPATIVVGDGLLPVPPARVLCLEPVPCELEHEDGPRLPMALAVESKELGPGPFRLAGELGQLWAHDPDAVLERRPTGWGACHG